MADKKDIGAMWTKTSTVNAGERYLYGKIEVNGKLIEFRAYKNKFKKAGDKTPDFRIFPVTARVTEAAPVAAKAAPVAEEPSLV